MVVVLPGTTSIQENIVNRLYFAYGSNMLVDRLAVRLGVVKMIGVGILENHTLLFNKKSIDGTAKANIKIEIGETVYGTVYKLNRQQFIDLDKIEGGYERIEKCIILGGHPTLVNVYVGKPGNIVDGLPINCEYLSLIVRGALYNRCPTHYINHIKKLSGCDCLTCY